MEEVWKDIKGYEGLYKISNTGKVKRLAGMIERGANGFLPVKEKIIKQNIGTTGYYQVMLWKNNKGHPKKVHRLVAETFLQNPQNKRIVDHIDTNPLNNNINNLRWATDKENCNNHITLLKQRKIRQSVAFKEKMREKHIGKTLSNITRQKISLAQKGKQKSALWKKVICLDTNIIYPSIKKASEETNIDFRQISAVCRGVLKSYKGSHWGFINEGIY